MKQRLITLCKRVSILLGIGLAYALFIQFTGLGIPCIINRITGFYCPGCGITRMCMAILQGEWKQAYYSNRLLFLLLPVAAVYGALRVAVYIKGIQWKESKIEKAAIWILAVIIILYGIARNIPAYSWLAPR